MVLLMVAVAVMLVLYILAVMPMISPRATPEEHATSTSFSNEANKPSYTQKLRSMLDGNSHNAQSLSQVPTLGSDACERLAQVLELKFDDTYKRMEDVVLSSYNNIVSHIQDTSESTSRTKSEIRLMERALIKLLDGTASSDLLAPKINAGPEEFVDRLCFKLEDCPTPECTCPKLDVVLEEQKQRLEEECRSKPVMQVVNCPPCNRKTPEGVSTGSKSTPQESPDGTNSSAAEGQGGALTVVEPNPTPTALVFDNDLASPSAADATTPHILAPKDPKGVFYVVVGAENSGNRYLVSMLAAANCMAVSGHNQLWDVPGGRYGEIDIEKLAQKLPKCAGVHRSYPHNGLWINLKSLLFQILSVGYEPRVIYVTRNILAVARSQINNHLAVSTRQAFVRIQKAKRDIYGYIANTQVWFREIEYEQLVHRKYLEYVYEELGYVGKEGEKIPPAHKHFRNANLKYKIEEP